MSRTSNPRAKRTVGKYHIVAKLAEGAMSSVFKARDPSTGKNFAIKVASLTTIREPVLLKRFEQEYRSTSTLSHPNIIRALEFGWEGQRPFIVMELVDGEDLWTRIERLGKLTETEAVDVITQVARGLHEAHKSGIIHRDLKPDNILLSADGQAKLADLGLSKDLESDLALTCADRGLGTPNFIAPEQFGDAKHATVRCDIYGLGATLYMALTGKLPFDAPSMSQTLKRKLADDLVTPRKLVPAISERVDFAVRRAVLADPDRRFGSCPEFLAALAGDGSSPPAAVVAAPSGAPRSTGKRFGRDRRGAVRYDCALPIQCTINLSVLPEMTEWQTQWEAQVVNLSVTGIGLVLQRRFEVGTVLTVNLKSSDGSAQQTREIGIVRVVRMDRGGWYLGGTLTEKLGKEDLRQLL